MRPLVIVPTYDERHNLPALVEELLPIRGLRVIVVDDGSPDGTGNVADGLAASAGGRVSVLHRTGRRGLGRSYIDGMQAALRTDATHICHMDADFSHAPADLPRLLDVSAEADLVIGSRYVPGGTVHNWPRRRVMLSTFANRYVRAVTGIRVRDCTSGFRCWRRELLAALPLGRILADGYAFHVEMAWQAGACGGRIVEVPITFVERREGASKMSGRIIWESAILPWRLATRHGRQR